MLTHRKDVYIYLCYGEFYDLLMMTPSLLSKRMLCDVHEVHALKFADDSIISSIFNLYYKRFVRTFIYHSQRTKDILDSLGVISPMLYVPHFKYSFKKDYDENLLDDELKYAFKSNKIRFLFFGNLSVVKGVETVIETFLNLPNSLKDKAELVIAGKNVDNIDFSMLRDSSESYKVFDRHINDDELVYLYKNTDYVLLPYKKSSQSGIFAMAEYFKKPMLLSDIPYFQKMISEFPSFGIVSSLEGYSNVIRSIINGVSIPNFYTMDDCNKNENKEITDRFVSQLKGLIDQNIWTH